MNATALRILLVEDNPADARLLQILLAEQASVSIQWTHVPRLSAAIEAVANDPLDVVLLDLLLPDGQGIETFTQLQAHASHLPIIVITGTDNETLALEAMHAGAQDYLVKGRIDGELLARTLRYSIERKRQNQRLKILREIDVAILAADSVESIVDAALSHIRELIDCRRASLTLFDWGSNEVLIFAISSVDETPLPPGRRIPLAQFNVVLPTLSQNQPMVFSDLRVLADPTPAIQLLLKDGLRSTCSLPLFSQGSLMGMFSMHSETPGFFDDEKIALGQEVANQVAIAITQRRLAQGLHESEQKFSVLFKRAPFATQLATFPAGEMVEVNEEFEKLVGYSREELIGKTSLELNMYPDPEIRARMVAEFQARGFVRNAELAFRTKFGDLRHLLISTDFVDIGGEKHVLTTAQDITERKQADEQLRYQAYLLENVNDAIIASDAQFRLKAWNLAAETIYGWKAEEVLGRNGVEILQTRFGEADAEEMRKQIAEAGYHLGEATQLRKDGMRIPVEVASIVLRDKDGKITDYVSVNRDITERKRVEAALRVENERFQRFVESNIVGIVIADASGRIITANDYYLNILSVTRQDFEDGKVDWRKFTPPEWLPADEKAIQELRERGVCEPYEKEYELADGTRVPVYLANAMLPGPEEQIAAFVLDITERKRAEKELRISEERFSKAFFASPAGLTITRIADGKFIDVNDAFLGMFEFSRAEVIGHTSIELNILSPEERAKLIQAQLESGGLRNAELQARAKSGRVVNILFSSKPMALGGETCHVTTMIDITERKRAEGQIQRQLQRLKALRTIDMAISTSFDMNLSLTVLLNQAMMQLGVSAAAILLHNPTTLTLDYAVGKGFPSSAIEQTRLRMGEGLAGRAALERRKTLVVNLREAGERYPRQELLKEEGFVSYYATPLVAKGELKGVLEVLDRAELHPNQEWLDFVETLAGQAAIAIDNSSLFLNLQNANAELEQRVEQRTAELHRLNLELEHASRAKDEFLANMSHELRTPLNSILGLSESLLEQHRGPLNEPQQKYLQMIESSGRHLLELINDILDLSKIEAGMLDYHPQLIAVDDICKASLAFVRSQAVKKSITLTYINEASVAFSYADPRRLKQILVNLLANAIKFTPDQGEVTLQVHTDMDQELIQFSILDSGIGIALDDLKRLFSPFVQVNSKLNRENEGTGLGLALVQKLTDLHGGSVEVESEVGKGSRFTINLHYEPDVSQQVQAEHMDDSLRVAERAERADRRTTDDPPHHRILLAENNAANILTIGDYLDSHGYEILVAHDGAEALEKVQAAAPDVILMDIQMPVMDGLEAIRRLRADSRFASTPIIALTALAMPGDRERCLEAGANEYMSKPVKLKSLIKTIQGFLQ